MPPEDDYEVGYKKPPKGTQFLKGRSGNPKGRPKGTLNLATTLEAALSERVVILENGQKRTITKLDAIVKQVVNKAAGGDLRAMKEVVGLMGSLLKVEEEGVDPVLGKADSEVAQHFFQRLRRQALAGVLAQGAQSNAGTNSNEAIDVAS